MAGAPRQRRAPEHFACPFCFPLFLIEHFAFPSSSLFWSGVSVSGRAGRHAAGLGRRSEPPLRALPPARRAAARLAAARLGWGGCRVCDGGGGCRGQGTLVMADGNTLLGQWRQGAIAGPVDFSFGRQTPWGNPEL